MIVEKLVDLSGLLRQVGERDDPVIFPTGRGDEARHGGSPDVRDKTARDKAGLDKPVHKPRDIYCPERLSTGIKVQTRDFR